MQYLLLITLLIVGTSANAQTMYRCAVPGKPPTYQDRPCASGQASQIRQYKGPVANGNGVASHSQLKRGQADLEACKALREGLAIAGRTHTRPYNEAQKIWWKYRELRLCYGEESPEVKAFLNGDGRALQMYVK